MPFIHDGGLWVTATNLDGTILWQTRAADYDAIYGFGSSPAIYGPLVIVAGDNDQTGAFMAALHRKSGEIVAQALYDHQTDPHEDVNLAIDDRHAPLLADLSKQLQAGWRAARP